jgi:hypothetical protein
LGNIDSLEDATPSTPKPIDNNSPDNSDTDDIAALLDNWTDDAFVDQQNNIATQDLADNTDDWLSDFDDILTNAPSPDPADDNNTPSKPTLASFSQNDQLGWDLVDNPLHDDTLSHTHKGQPQPSYNMSEPDDLDELLRFDDPTPEEETETVDLETVFDDDPSEDTQDTKASEQISWLPYIGDEDSATLAYIRRQQDKPIDDLDDRLKSLRERGQASSTQDPASPVLPDVEQALIAPTRTHQPSGITNRITLTDDQKKQAELLQDIVGVSITPSIETNTDGTPRIRATRSRRQQSTQQGRTRHIIAGLLLLVVLVPFVFSNLGIGASPPQAFGTDDPKAAAVFAQINALNAGDYVLVGFEYGPTAAGELDTLSDVLLRHIFAQGAIPIIVSSNPVGIVHAENILDDIDASIQDSGLDIIANTDYYIVRYLAGDTIGLRDLSQNVAGVINRTVKGEPTNLTLTSLDDMALLLLIAERSDNIRSWAEQVAPSTTTTLMVATGYAAQPLAEPYINQTDGIQGLLVGYRDAYTYGDMFQSLYITSTPAPLHTPQATDTDVPTATVTDTEGNAQSAPTLEPLEPTITLSPMPTVTPIETVTPAPTGEIITVIIINAPTSTVNVRTGPGTTYPVLTSAQNGDIYRMIGENSTGDWINFLLADGRTGWIASFLTNKIVLPDSSAAIDSDVTVVRASYRRRMGNNRGRFYQQADPTLTIITPIPSQIPPTATMTPTITPTPTVTAIPSPTPNPSAGFALSRDRRQEDARLNAMTLGTIAAVVIILFGNIYFGLQAIKRHRREAKH